MFCGKIATDFHLELSGPYLIKISNIVHVLQIGKLSLFINLLRILKPLGWFSESSLSSMGTHGRGFNPRKKSKSERLANERASKFMNL